MQLHPIFMSGKPPYDLVRVHCTHSSGLQADVSEARKFSPGFITLNNLDRTKCHNLHKPGVSLHHYLLSLLYHHRAAALDS